MFDKLGLEELKILRNALKKEIKALDQAYNNEKYRGSGEESEIKKGMLLEKISLAEDMRISIINNINNKERGN